MWSKFFKVIQTNVSALLMIVLMASTIALTPMTPQGEVQKAEALFGIGDAVFVVGGSGTIQETLSAASNAITAGIQEAFFIKEFTLDPIFHGLAKMVLKSMTQSILTWINSGFQGSPAFVTDLGQFLQDAADQVVGDFIYNDPALNFLCSPFQLDVKIALAETYQAQSSGEDFASEAQCTLSDVTDNVEGFLNGSFSQGGWDSWFEVTQNPSNTPTGAYLAAEAEMHARIVNEQGQAIKELDWGDGFLSFKVCDDTNGSGKNCNISTPGTVIANQINKTLGAGQDELIAADEVNEIISALFAQLAKQAITGINGLLGLGGSQYSDSSFGDGSQSYLDALGNERGGTSGLDPMLKAIENEEEHYDLQRDVLIIVAGAEADLQKNQASSSCAQLQNVRMPRGLVTAGEISILQQFVSSSTIAELTALSAQYQDAETPSEQLEIIEKYNKLKTDGALKTQIDNVRLDLYIKNEIAQMVDKLENDIDSAVQSCNR
ncbi:MAG: hypothetical protein ACI92I_000273 [Acidimicrobiales bacterium]|jgi:hypothetical protein